MLASRMCFSTHFTKENTSSLPRLTQWFGNIQRHKISYQQGQTPWHPSSVWPHAFLLWKGLALGSALWVQLTCSEFRYRERGDEEEHSVSTASLLVSFCCIFGRGV